MKEKVRKKAWIIGGLAVVLVLGIVLYFTCFRQEKKEPRGTFVRGVEVQWQQNA